MINLWILFNLLFDVSLYLFSSFVFIRLIGVYYLRAE